MIYRQKIWAQKSAKSRKSWGVVENLPDVLDIHIDDEPELDSFHQHLLLDVGQG